MREQEPGLNGPLAPLDLRKTAPLEEAASSDRLGWVGLEAERSRAPFACECNSPALAHHRLVLFARPPEELDLRYEGVKRHVPPPAGSILLVPADLLALAPDALAAPAKLELEELPPEDRAAFAADLGLAGSQRDDILRRIFAAMGQIVFLTVGEDECRAWPIPQGADAVEGAAQIHTDLSKRFVRAEVVAYDDFVRVGSMKEAKAQGVYRLEGKTYVVRDGDIMHILASS
jgi:hypothetical protein